MKKWMFSILSLALVKLHGAHFQSTMSLTPTTDSEYLVEMRIEKIVNNTSQLIAAPKLVCALGEPAELTIGSKEDPDFLLIQATVSQAKTEKHIHTLISMKENGEIVLSSDQAIQLN